MEKTMDQLGLIEQHVGHVQCRGGISDIALFAACIDAVAKLKKEDSTSVLATIQEAVNLLLPNEKFGKWNWNPAVSRESPTSPLSLYYELPGTDVIQWTDELKNWLSNKDESKWILSTCLQVFGEVENVSRKLTETEFPIILEIGSLICVLGILHCFAIMGIRRVSLSAIPYSATHGSIHDAILGELLLGLPVLPTELDTIVTPPTLFAVATLRVLANEPVGNPHKEKPMILEASGLGMENSTVVSMAVGRTMGTSESTQASASPSLWMTDRVTHFESNMDDTTGEILAHAIELLLSNGAMDAWVTPIVMKKGRPASTLHCLCMSQKQQEDKLLEVVFRHTTTLGVRIYRDLPRAKLQRSMIVAQTPYTDTARHGCVDVKVSSFKTGEIVTMKPEFDHCKEISNESGVPVKFVTEAALSAAREVTKTRGTAPLHKS